MIFASDLDRTLIFSKQFVLNDTEGVTCIEYKDGEEVSYIHKNALNKLTFIHNIATIIPVTARNKQQFDRISLFKGYLTPKYVITNNGGSIYIDDELDTNWNKYVTSQLEQLETNYESVLEYFLARYEGSLASYTLSDNLVWILKVEDQSSINRESIENNTRFFYKLGWGITVTGRKIYLYPKKINKASALQYIKTRLLPKQVCIVSGDSTMDACLNCIGDICIMPKNSELHSLNTPNFLVTEHSGLHATEDILDIVLSHIGTQM